MGRKDLKICLFNNSYNSDDDEMPDIEEIKKLWQTILNINLIPQIIGSML